MKNKKHIFIYLILTFTSISIMSCSTAKQTTEISKSTPVFSLEDRQFSYFFHEAVRQRILQKYDVALEMLLKCEQIDDKNAALMYELANIYSQTGKFDYAIAYLTRATHYDDSNIWYKINLASLYLAIGDIKSATEIYENASEKHPEKDELREGLYQLYVRQQRYNEAINVLNNIEKRQGITEEVSFEKYRIYANLGEEKKAEKEIDALIKKYPNDMKYNILRGNIYEGNGDMAKALKIYNYVLAREPENGYARLSLAEHYEKTGEQDKAVAEINYTLRSQNIDVETKINLLHRYIGILEDRDEWKKRLPALFESLLEMHPDVVEIRQFYALYLINTKEFDTALKEIETILDIDPKNEEAWEQTMNIKIIQGKMEDLVDMSKKAIEVLPENPQWYLYLGTGYSQLKKNDDAIEAYEKGLTLVSEDNKKLKSDIYGSLADVYFDKKENDLAFENYDKSLQNNPLNTHVLNNYAYYLALEKKDLLRAEAMAKKCLDLEPSSYVLDTYAWVLFQQGYYNLAKRYLQEAMKLDGSTNDEVLYEHYGDVLYKTDSKDEAIEMWKKSLEMGNKSEKLLLKIEKQEYVE